MSDRQKPPPTPWVRGKQAGYTALDLVIHLCQDATGRVWSEHDFREALDEATSKTLKGFGNQQIAYALLVEAARREAFVDAMLTVQNNPDYLERYKAGDEALRDEMEAFIGDRATEVMTRTLRKMAPGIGKEILWMLTGQIHTDREGSNPPPTG